MMLFLPRWFRFLCLTVLLAFFLSGCAGSQEAVSTSAPPPAGVQSRTDSNNTSSSQLPVHGQRARMHSYRYYPKSYVYFEPARGLYFYFSHGQWQSSTSLPAGFQVDVEKFVNIQMRSERPYEHFVEHRQQYPPE